MASQIIEEKQDDDDEEEDSPVLIDSEAQKNKVRQIIKYQKYLYYSSSSSLSSSAGASCSSFTSSRRSSSLLDLMKVGSTSLRRLIDMEHTTLKTYLDEYSGSPMIKPIFLWGSDADDGKKYDDPWSPIKQARMMMMASTPNDFKSGKSSGDHSRGKKRSNMQQNTNRRRLTRKKSFRRLPRFGLWLFSGFRIFGFRLRLRRLRVMICGRKL
ncbi:OLC1v1033723C1 [Oldenlandia corymbosa var. corymbosa]|uniref:OLC1v1033723C1 n=1 Tax=Oldenlandia corymbosa var. corymbosa TaxID=529605 RepID=A0AAV1CRJ1_OLDCO|nr:OLC1v1033723C1 [Oldenlandia corymbosa var. corymbosa]